MNLWLLERSIWDYDETISMIVAAIDETEAREVAAAWCREPDPYGTGRREPPRVEEAFMTPGKSTCKLVPMTQPQVVHSHVRHG